MDNKVIADKETLLFNLNETIKHEPRFQHLRTPGINYVAGEGNLDASIMVVGEAPGATENALRKPFVGTCGKILSKTLQTVGLDRSDIYITNVLKFRPPNNRKPLVFESIKAMEFIAAEIHIIDPKVIIPMGNSALNLFYPMDKISSVVGNLRIRNARIIIPSFHPGAVIRDLRKQKSMLNVFADAKDAAKNYDQILSEYRV